MSPVSVSSSPRQTKTANALSRRLQLLTLGGPVAMAIRTLPVSCLVLPCRNEKKKGAWWRKWRLNFSQFNKVSNQRASSDKSCRLLQKDDLGWVLNEKAVFTRKPRETHRVGNTRRSFKRFQRKRDSQRALAQWHGGGTRTEAALTPGVMSVNYGAAELIQFEACHAETGGWNIGASGKHCTVSVSALQAAAELRINKVSVIIKSKRPSAVFQIK